LLNNGLPSLDKAINEKFDKQVLSVESDLRSKFEQLNVAFKNDRSELNKKLSQLDSKLPVLDKAINEKLDNRALNLEGEIRNNFEKLKTAFVSEKEKIDESLGLLNNGLPSLDKAINEKFDKQVLSVESDLRSKFEQLNVAFNNDRSELNKKLSQLDSKLPVLDKTINEKIDTRALNLEGEIKNNFETLKTAFVSEKEQVNKKISLLSRKLPVLNKAINENLEILSKSAGDFDNNINNKLNAFEVKIRNEKDLINQKLSQLDSKLPVLGKAINEKLGNRALNLENEMKSNFEKLQAAFVNEKEQINKKLSLLNEKFPYLDKAINENLEILSKGAGDFDKNINNKLSEFEFKIKEEKDLINQRLSQLDSKLPVLDKTMNDGKELFVRLSGKFETDLRGKLDKLESAFKNDKEQMHKKLSLLENNKLPALDKVIKDNLDKKINGIDHRLNVLNKTIAQKEKAKEQRKKGLHKNKEVAPRADLVDRRIKEEVDRQISLLREKKIKKVGKEKRVKVEKRQRKLLQGILGKK